MTHQTLSVIWFCIWGVIWSMYFVLDGYSLGTGIWFPFLAKTEQQEKQLQEVIGPFWGSNEVWLITAGGVTFAAFPKIYATMFSFLYIPLFLLLFGLFFRATGLEFMHKDHDPHWRSFWKWAFFAGSLLTPLLLGVAFSNLFLGLNLGTNVGEGINSFSQLINLLNLYGLLGGWNLIALCLLTGAIWISWKTAGDIQLKAIDFAKKLWLVAFLTLLVYLFVTFVKTPIIQNYINHPILWIVPILSIVSMLFAKFFLKNNKLGKSFLAISLSILTLFASGFIGMFPNMLLSRIADIYSITAYQAAASTLTLKIMLIVTVCVLPIIAIYQIWIYRFFRRKITPENARGYH